MSKTLIKNDLIEKYSQSIDLSAVKADSTKEEIINIAEIAKKHNLVCAFALPSFTKLLIETLEGCPVNVGGVVGFPSGADTTSIKQMTAKEHIALGCREIDMVTNIGAMKSKEYRYFKEDIRAVVEAAQGLPVKAILEIAYLTEDEIKKASQLAVEAGATYIKTGTGWSGKPTTVQDIVTIKSAVGDTAKIKAAGGINTFDKMSLMIKTGCDRIGIGIHSFRAIFGDI